MYTLIVVDYCMGALEYHIQYNNFNDAIGRYRWCKPFVESCKIVRTNDGITLVETKN